MAERYNLRNRIPDLGIGILSADRRSVAQLARDRRSRTVCAARVR